MLPLPPEGLTASGKRKWRDDELRKMWMPTGVSQATSSTPAAPAAPVPKASTRARAGAAYWPKRPKGQFLTRLGRWFRFGWLRKGTSLLTLLLAVALSGRRGPVMQFARIIGAAADLSESTADVAVSASGASQRMPANGLTTGANLWKGVSLHDLHAHRCNGQLLVDGPDSLASWLNSSQAATLVPCLDAHLRRQLQAASESINVAISMTQTATDELDIGASTGAQAWGLWFIALGVFS